MNDKTTREYRNDDLESQTKKETVSRRTFGAFMGATIASHKNVYYKYTTLLIEQLLEAKVSLKGFLHHMVGVYGADHLVWGSDIGNSEVSLDKFVTHALDSADGLTLQEKKAIFCDTAKTVFVRGGRGAKRP